MSEMTDASAGRPEDFGIPGHYQSWQGDAAEDHNGPFFFTMNDGVAETMFRVQEHNCNAHQSVHGGVLMMFADYTLCIAAIGGSYEGVVTVSCNSEFIGPAYAGDLVRGRGEVTRRGGSLVFVRVTLETDQQIILTASGVVKRLRKRS